MQADDVLIKLALAAMSKRQKAAAGGLIALLLLGAVVETVVFLLIVPLAQAVASGEQELRQQIGGVTVEAAATDLAVAIAAMVVLLTLVRLVANYLQYRLATGVERQERTRLFDSYMTATWEVQAQEPPGRFQSIAGFAAAKGELLGVFANSARYTLNVGVMISAAFIVSPVGALSISLLGGLMFLGFRPLVAASRRVSGEHAIKLTQHNEDLGELVGVGADMRVFGASQGFRARLSTSLRLSLDAKRRAAVLSGSVVPVYQAIGLTIAVVILGYAANRDVDVAVLGTVVILLIRSMSYGQSLQGMVQKLAEYRPAVEMFESWLATYAASPVSHGDRPIERIATAELDQVSYVYPDGTTALRDVDLTARRGDELGIVGPSGSGKSTLVQLLLGLRRATHGQVRINGVDLFDYDEDALRRCIALVPQRANVFRGSIADNIAIFRSELTRDDVERAARAAGLHETVMQLPDGYETEVGPGKRDVSGGQAQRIGIARALAGQPSLIVLDEPTSALDVDSEALITDTIRALPDDVIVVIVAHRISTLRNCNKLAVLEGGRQVAVGTPAEVLSGSDFYRRAVSSGAVDDDIGSAGLTP